MLQFFHDMAFLIPMVFTFPFPLYPLDFSISVDQLLIKDPTRQFLLTEYGVLYQNTHSRCIAAIKISHVSQIINFLSKRFICRESYCRNSQWMFFWHHLSQWTKNFLFILKPDQGCTGFEMLYSPLQFLIPAYQRRAIIFLLTE